MYAGAFNNPENDTGQTCHSNEQKFGDLWGLLAQDLFPSILPSTDDPVFKR